MFERYTEKARRTIFFARYEASQFGSAYIESEHLLLGLFREDKALAGQFLPSFSNVETIRSAISQYGKTILKVATSIDLPLSHESKRALAYAAEEGERMKHKYIGTPHLLVGLLREENSLAAQLLREQGLTLESVRDRAQQLAMPLSERRSAVTVRLDEWLAGWEARGGILVVKQTRVASKITYAAIYAGDPPKEGETTQNMSPSEKVAQLQKRVDFLVVEMERAIALHQFEKARSYSDEERKAREDLRSLCEQFELEAPPPRLPFLCIELIHDQHFSEFLEFCDDYVAAGVAHIWFLAPDYKRAYTATKAEGLREFQGEILRIANPPLEMDLRTIFD
jgi:hypothetical protein